MKQLILKRGSALLTDLAGPALLGLALDKFARVRETLDRLLPKRSGLTVGELVTAYGGPLCTRPSDFDAIENHRRNGFFPAAFEPSGVPVASTLGMQPAAQAEVLTPHVDELPVTLLKQADAPITALACGLCR